MIEACMKLLLSLGLAGMDALLDSLFGVCSSLPERLLVTT
jgi:hypothetical protein